MRTARRARAALVLAAFWGAGLGAIGLAVELGFAIWSSPELVMTDPAGWWGRWHGTMLRSSTGMATFGALAGLGFAAVLSLVERGQRAHTLSHARTALWGAVGGGVLYLLVYVLPPAEPLPRAGWGRIAYPLLPVLTSAMLGALFARTSLLLARRSAPASDAPDDAVPAGEPGVIGAGDELGARGVGEARTGTPVV
jgi:hypothetical protein